MRKTGIRKGLRAIYEELVVDCDAKNWQKLSSETEHYTGWMIS